ncbi:MAG: fibronectin type III domain-containing protein [Candidatus Limnocylindrales bacterium]
MVDRTTRGTLMRYSPALTLALLILVSTTAAPVAASGTVRPRVFDGAPGAKVTFRALDTVQRFDPIPAPAFSGAPDADGAYAVAATADIDVTYSGFGVDNRGLAAQQAFEAAVTVWESLVVSSQPIHVSARWINLGSGGVLGSAGPSDIYELSDKRWYPVALAEAICSCNANSSASADIDADFNSVFQQWYLGTDGNAGSTQYDFYTVVLHELGHGLGFLGSFDSTGTSAEYGWWDGQAVRPMRYDALYDQQAGGNLLISYPNPSSQLKAQLTDGTVFFGGNNVVATLGQRAALYAPSPWNPGSSNAHFDEASFPPGTVNALMTPYLSNGEVIHDPGPAMLAVFRDIGWTITGPSPTAPDAPTGVTAVAGNASAFASWTAPASNGGSPITSYTVTSAPDGVTCVTSGTGCDVYPLTNGTPYTFTVVATNTVGAGPVSDPSNEVTPDANAVDLIAPAVSSPTVVIVAPAQLGATATLRLTWADASDPSGISRYDLQRLKGTGSWMPVTLASPTATTADVAVTPGKQYNFRLRAVDGANNVGDWITTTPRKLGLAQENAAAVSYSGSWTRSSLSGASGGYVRQTGGAGRLARLTFTGTSAALMSTLARSRGIAELWLDGSAVGTVDLYSGTLLTRQVVWSTGNLAAGTHTLDVRVTGIRNPLATRNRVDVDAFLVWP